MNIRKHLLSAALTAALSLGVWGAAVTFRAAEFRPGDSLSAAELSGLLNDNFGAARTQLAELQTRLAVLEDIAALEETEPSAPAGSLPLAFGSLNADGSTASGTQNFTAEKVSEGTYDIRIDGVAYNSADYATIIQPVAGNAHTQRIATGSASGQSVRVRLFPPVDGSAPVDTPFHFVVYRAP